MNWNMMWLDRRVVNGHYLPKDRSSLGTAMFFDIRKLFSHISMMAIKKTKWSSLSRLARSAVKKTVIAVNKYLTLSVGCCAITACEMPNIYHVWRTTVKKRHHASWIETWLDGCCVQWYLLRFLPVIDWSLFGPPKNSNQSFLLCLVWGTDEWKRCFLGHPTKGKSTEILCHEISVKHIGCSFCHTRKKFSQIFVRCLKAWVRYAAHYSFVISSF